MIAHHTGGVLLPLVGDESTKAEIQQVVPRDDQKILHKAQTLNGKLDVPHRAQTRLVALGAVIQDGNRKIVPVGPATEMMHKAVVRDHHIFIHDTGPVDVLQQPVQNGLVPYLQQGLRKVLGQGIESCGVSRRQNQTFHARTPSALSQR